MNRFQDNQEVVILGIERGWRQQSFSGNIRDPLDFIQKMAWTFPSGVDDRDETVYKLYEADMDQYMVVGKNGLLSYISPVTGFEEGAIDIPSLVSAIRLALNAFVPVRPATWSSIKVKWVP